MRTVDYVVVLIMIAGGVAVAVSLSRPTQTAPPPVSTAGAMAIEDRLQSLETSTAARLDEQATRIAAIEGAPIRDGAPAPEAWTEADVAALRVGLEMIKEADQRGREAQRLRQVIAHIVPDAEPAVREQAVTQLLEAIQKARAEPAQANDLRTALQEKLQEILPAGVARRVAGLVPVDEPAEGER